MPIENRNSGGTVTQALQDMLGIISRVSSAMNSLARGNDLAKYWDNQSKLIDSVTRSYERLNSAKRSGNKDDAARASEELVKYMNALRATAQLTKTDLSSVMSDYGKIAASYSDAVRQAQHANEAFSIEKFAQLIPLFELLRDHGMDVKQVFDQFAHTASTDELRQQVEQLNQSLADSRNKIHELQDELESAYAGSGVTELKEQLEELSTSIDEIHKQAAREYVTFANANRIDPFADKWEYIFDNVRDGSYTANQAITELKRQAHALFEQNGTVDSGIFDTVQWQNIVDLITEMSTRVGELHTMLSSGEGMFDLGSKFKVEDTTSAVISEIITQLQGLATASSDVKAEVPPATKALTEMMQALGQVSSSGEQSLERTLSIFRNLRQFLIAAPDSGGKSSLAAIPRGVINSLKNLITETSSAGTATNLQVLAGIDWSKLLALNTTASRGSGISVVARNLPKLAATPVEPLAALARIDWNNLATGLAALDGKQIKFSFDYDAAADALKNGVGAEGGALDQVKKKFEDHIKVLQDAKTAEHEKAEEAEILAEKLRAEKDALDQVQQQQQQQQKQQQGQAASSYSLNDLEQYLLKIGVSQQKVTAIKTEFDSVGASVVTIDEHLNDVNGRLERVRIAAKNAAGDILRVVSGQYHKATKGQSADWAFTEAKRQFYGTVPQSQGKQYRTSGGTSELALMTAYINQWQQLEQRIESYRSALKNAGATEEAQIRSAITETDKLRGIKEKAARAFENKYPTQFAKQEAEWKEKRQLAGFDRDVSAGRKADVQAAKDEAQAVKDMNAAFADRTIRMQRIVGLQKQLVSATGAEKQDIEDKIRAEGQQVQSLKTIESTYSHVTGYAERLAKYEEDADRARRDLQTARVQDSQKASQKAEREEERRDLRAQATAIRNLIDMRRELGKAQFGEGRLIPKLSADTETLPQYQELVQVIQQLQTALQGISNIRTSNIDGSSVELNEQQLQTIQQLVPLFERYRTLLTDVNKANAENLAKQARATTAAKQLQNLETFWEQNGDSIRRNASATQEYYSLLDRWKNAASLTADEQNRLVEETERWKASVKEAGLTVPNFLQRVTDIFGNKLIYGAMAAMASQIRRLARQVYTNVKEIDGAMTQLKIVTGATDQEMTRFLTKSTELAKELGKSISDVLNSVQTFSRLGYNLSDASELTKYTTILSNVANVEAEEATTGLTAIIKGYNMAVSDSEHVADVLVSVGQKYAVSASELMQAFQRGGAALNASGTSFEKSAALIAAANASLQNAETVGTVMKTLSARIRGSKTELEELGEEYGDVANGISKYRKEIMALTNVNGKGGFDIMSEADETQYKDVYDIFVGLADVWDQLSDTTRARISEILGGTRNLSAVSSVIQNIADATGAYADAMNSAGVATEANAKYMDSIAGRIGQLTASFQELSRDFLSSDTVKRAIEFLKAITGIADELAKVNALLPAIMTLIAVKSAVGGSKQDGFHCAHVSSAREGSYHAETWRSKLAA